MILTLPSPDHTQRWREGRHSFRQRGADFRSSAFDVVELEDDTRPRDFVERHHYSQTYPAARFRFGLFGPSGIEGVAVFSHPAQDLVLTRAFGGKATDSVELGRFVLLDEVPFNAESWFLGRAFDLLRDRVVGVLSCSDDAARTDIHGRVVFGGHLGTIYQATNAWFDGRGAAKTIRLLPDGRTFSARAISKIRAQERGWGYAAQQLVDAGADPITGDPREWLRTWLPRVTRPFRHPGTLRYLFDFRRMRVGPRRRYPKRDGWQPPAERLAA